MQRCWNESPVRSIIDGESVRVRIRLLLLDVNVVCFRRTGTRVDSSSDVANLYRGVENPQPRPHERDRKKYRRIQIRSPAPRINALRIRRRRRMLLNMF